MRNLRQERERAVKLAEKIKAFWSSPSRTVRWYVPRVNVDAERHGTAIVAFRIHSDMKNGLPPRKQHKDVKA